MYYIMYMFHKFKVSEGESLDLRTTYLWKPLKIKP